MPRPRFNNLPREKQQAIINTAAREFAEHGYSGASVNRIIEAAGFSKGVFYYYFDDKEDLFLSVILDAHYQAYDFMDDFPEVKTPKEFWSAARDLFGKVMAYAMEKPLVIGLQKAFASALAGGDLKRPMAEFQQPHFDFHKKFVRIGQKVGAVRTDIPDDLLFSMLESIDEAGDNWFAEHFDEIKTADWEKILGRFLLIYRRILKPGPDTKEKML